MQKVMRKSLFVVAFTLIVVAIQAQPARDDIRRYIRMSASSDMPYPYPQQHVLTEAPGNKKPFYISHYGRHGSCYLDSASYYDTPCRILSAADNEGKLTSLGRDVLYRLHHIRLDAVNRWGELTALGGYQHRQIMERMVRHFPDVFTEHVSVDACCAPANRCSLSMEFALMQLSMLHPQLHLFHQATRGDLSSDAPDETLPYPLMPDTASQRVFNDFCRKSEDTKRLMQSLFNDPDYVRRHVDASLLNSSLFLLASNLQNTEISNRVTLYDLFTDDEAYRNWTMRNAWMYLVYGASPVTGGRRPYSQSALLRTIIQQADSCLRLPNPGVQLRFGFDSVLLPLVCLLDIGPAGLATDRLETLDRRGWHDYQLVPMAANLQLVFYRESPADDDVLVKVLLNENECSLPFDEVEGPYYRWRDFREYYLKKLEVCGER